MKETAGAVEEEQASEVFLKTLGELFAGQMVWVDTAGSRKESRSRATLVGKVADPRFSLISHVKDDTPINLSRSRLLLLRSRTRYVGKAGRS